MWTVTQFALVSVTRTAQCRCSRQVMLGKQLTLSRWWRHLHHMLHMTISQQVSSRSCQVRQMVETSADCTYTHARHFQNAGATITCYSKHHAAVDDPGVLVCDWTCRLLVSFHKLSVGWWLLQIICADLLSNYGEAQLHCLHCLSVCRLPRGVRPAVPVLDQRAHDQQHQQDPHSI